MMNAKEARMEVEKVREAKRVEEMKIVEGYLEVEVAKKVKEAVEKGYTDCKVLEMVKVSRTLALVEELRNLGYNVKRNAGMLEIEW